MSEERDMEVDGMIADMLSTLKSNINDKELSGEQIKKIFNDIYFCLTALAENKKNKSK